MAPSRRRAQRGPFDSDEDEQPWEQGRRASGGNGDSGAGASHGRRTRNSGGFGVELPHEEDASEPPSQEVPSSSVPAANFHQPSGGSRISTQRSASANAQAPPSDGHGAPEDSQEAPRVPAQTRLKLSLKRAPRRDAGGDGEAAANDAAAASAHANGNGHGDDQDEDPEDEGPGKRRSLRPRASKTVTEPDAEGEDEDAPGESYHEDFDDEDEEVIPQTRTTRSGRHTKRPSMYGANLMSEDDFIDDDDDDEDPRKRKNGGGGARRSQRRGGLGGFVAPDDEDEIDDEAAYGSSRRRRPNGNGNGNARNKSAARVAALAKKRRSDIKDRNARYTSAARRSSRRGGASSQADPDGDFQGGDTSEEEESLDLPEDDEDEEEEDKTESQGMRLRERKQVNYTLPGPPPANPTASPRGKQGWGVANGAGGGAGGGGRAPFVRRHGYGRGRKTGWDALPASMSGKDLAALFGEADDDSDSDVPKKAGAAGRAGPGGAAGASILGGPATAGMLAGGLPPAPTSKSGLTGDLTGTGATDTMGKLKQGGDPLADIDPLGTDMQIDFDSVGGLDGHIEQLKEMVTLPLLYPELFQRFKITPPRGVLFHGPPGTGKTLVARALAASCSSEGQRISFFMRKGADVLSKWVGEAERQLRLLFEEAKNSQPSIIFFDEIDGLAPVRSSKQDQIHASIVSTLLALMDGMDGRGQVVVIGATNRPDSVDPALRRPGRFDREFYFPLPNKDARRKIIDIHTRKWEPPLEPDFKDRLAELTKGYGGADMRALCTEAALNAIQRRYPQIYQTTDRLLLQPETVKVEAKDFMMSINKIVPSSARSASSAAAPLPDHLKPLLTEVTERACAALDKVLPEKSKRTALEEALWEDGPSGQASASTSAAGSLAVSAPASDFGFGREMLLQSFQNMRVFRPRLLVHGEGGMGQRAVGAAMLQHLEGYHVQSIDVASLMNDSARTPEAAAIQLFTEAKRHKPSVLYIPGLAHWANTVSESVRSTVKALLDGLSPSDPILLLGISEAPLSELPRDVRSWFGLLRENRIEVTKPTREQREVFFADISEHISRPPTAFPDAVPRKKRVLEKLPVAPPRPPREPTAAELQQQAENDRRLLEHLKYRLGPVLQELRKKYKVFTKDVSEEYNLQYLKDNFEYRKEKGCWIFHLPYERTEEEIEELRQAKAAAAAIRAPVQSAADSSMADGQAALPNGTANEEAGTAAAINGEQQAPDVSMQGPAPEPDAAADPGPDQEDESALRIRWEDTTLWTMSLEKMQKKLYYDAYYSVSDFLSDLQKVVHNAEAAESVDVERTVKARQMSNLANIMLDQFIDSAFRAECESMAVRNKARDEEARKAAEKDAPKRRESRKVSGPILREQPRHSARIAGEQPQHRYPVDVSAVERRASAERKRSRESGSSERSSSADPHTKRARTAEPERALHEESSANAQAPDQSARSDRMDINSLMTFSAPTPVPAPISVVAQPMGAAPASPPTLTVEPPSQQLPVEAPVAPPQPSTAGAAAGTLAVTMDKSPFAVVEAEVQPESEPEPEPEPVYPPFVLSPSSKTRLQQELIVKTDGMTIEELDQVRAACFDAIWRRRSDWNREPLAQELLELVNEMAMMVSQNDADEE